jgi:hypothetical protein
METCNLVTVRIVITLALSASAAAGVLVSQVTDTRGGRQDVRSITGEIIAANDGSLQSIRGIKGIDTVMLQNLEAVLRMQAPPPPPQAGGGGGGVRAAAELLTMKNDEPPEPQDESDGREELTELELEGS